MVFRWSFMVKHCAKLADSKVKGRDRLEELPVAPEGVFHGSRVSREGLRQAREAQRFRGGQRDIARNR